MPNHSKTQRTYETESRDDWLDLLMIVLGAAASLAAILLYGFFRGGWLDALLAGIALGMSMLSPSVRLPWRYRS